MLAGTEYGYIVRIINETNWVVSDKNGDAERLGLSRLARRAQRVNFFMNKLSKMEP